MLPTHRLTDMRNLIRSLCMALLWVLSAAALAAPADHILERAYVVDEAGTLSLEQVRQMPAQRYEGPLGRGFTESATWIRITVEPVLMARPGEMLVVRVRPVYLDEIRLFDPLDTGGVTLQTPSIFASLILISVLGLALYGVVVAVERVVAPWAFREQAT